MWQLFVLVVGCVFFCRRPERPAVAVVRARRRRWRSSDHGHCRQLRSRRRVRPGEGRGPAADADRQSRRECAIARDERGTKGRPSPIICQGASIERGAVTRVCLSSIEQVRLPLSVLVDEPVVWCAVWLTAALQSEWVSGFFDRGTFVESLAGWARTVIVGRARLGGIPVGVILPETQPVVTRSPADPASPESHETTVTQAGGVWYPDSAFKTAQVGCVCRIADRRASACYDVAVLGLCVCRWVCAYDARPFGTSTARVCRCSSLPTGEASPAVSVTCLTRC